ncbi:MAG: c-type cytochrome domain-containing protein, partial [Opitutales bacterium]
MSFRRLPLLAFLAAGLTSAVSAAPVAFDEVRAIFEGKCLECHNPDKTKGKLLMTTREGFLKGGESGHALIGVAADQSELVKRLVLPKDHDDIMPPKGGPLPAAEIDVIRRWVAEGAAWPAGVVLAAKDKAKEEAKAELAQKLTTLEKLEIFPESVALETKRDFHRIVVFATFKDATTRDVTAYADLKVADDKVAAFDGYSVHAVADAGKTEVVASLGGRTARIPVAVKEGHKDRAVSFRQDVMPVFLRANCNSGGCHGAARGKDG